jgi:hypothetical protein
MAKGIADRRAALEQQNREVDELIAEHPDWPDWKVAAAVGVPRTRVWNARQSEKRGSRFQPSPEKGPLILADLHLGKKHAEIAATHHVSLSRVSRLARENGLSKRARKGSVLSAKT